MVKNPPANVGSIPGLEGYPREGNGNLLQYSCLRNPMDRGAWWATVHGGHKRSWTLLSNLTTTIVTRHILITSKRIKSSQGLHKLMRQHCVITIIEVVYLIMAL